MTGISSNTIAFSSSSCLAVPHSRLMRCILNSDLTRRAYCLKFFVVNLRNTVRVFGDSSTHAVPPGSWRVQLLSTFFEKPSIYKTDERGEKIQVLQTICRKPLTGNSKSCVVTVADSSIPTTPCCLASAFPRQHPVLLSSIGGCCVGNDFAV